MTRREHPPRARGAGVAHQALLRELAALEDDKRRQNFLGRHHVLVRHEAVEELARAVVERVRVDTREALRLAAAAESIAHRLRRKDSIALAHRATANALYASGDNRAAVRHHEKAIQLYETLEDWKEAARTLSSSIQPLILLGEYDRATGAWERARDIFTRLGEPWRLARLEINAGNIFHRQDRFEEALAHYENAYKGLMPHGDAEGLAVVLSNMSVCLISLNDFPRALATYQRAREVCERNHMPLLVAQADYNIAYLYCLRGEYTQAIEMLYAARRGCEATGDGYHFALCHLDLADLYLELNLSEESREMAHEGFVRFEALGTGYEAAKCLALEAMAIGQQGKTALALERFDKARELFAREKNRVWPWLLDLYQALLLAEEGRYFEARRLAAGAAAFFDSSILVGKAVLAHLMLARIALEMGDMAQASREADAAVARLPNLERPVLEYQVHFLRGQIAQRSGNAHAAYALFEEARKVLETLRGRLQAEELKISFVKNRLLLYEALVDLFLSGQADGAGAEEAFVWIEAAKSRSMSEMIFQGSRSIPAGTGSQSGLVGRIRELREELNWYYHRIELEELRPEEISRERIERLQADAQARETELLRTLRELPAHERETATLEAPPEFSLPRVQAAIPADATLVEYYSSGDRVIAAVATRTGVEILPVTLVSRTARSLQLLRFQLSKFRLGLSYVQRFAEPLLRATESHLDSLGAELFAPLRALVRGTRLIVVPHGGLHFLPFHALRVDGRYLCDDFTVSYAPSATVFSLCQEKPWSKQSASLVMGVPDARAPEILAEVQAAARLLPHAELFVGERATSAVLHERGPECRLLHLATHGKYRQDNPMFSGIRLGDGYLNLYDLYQMRLGTRLAVLSGCATGMNVVAEGDELLGLQRGLFCAGAAAVMLSLWDVHDRSTAALMQSFYRRYIETDDMAGSLRAAMLQIRAENPHPYFWAPFILAGKVTDFKSVS
ncbi:MAG TPA: CHAT domain-containing protein [Terriglobales bacterium]|nr:CHAT domain-containing protein [Terriglobales bacterium]